MDKNKPILTKQSDSQQMRAYFECVSMLADEGSEFPINLDQVWRLSFERKDHAVRALKESTDFIEGVDYQVFPQNGENSNRGRRNIEYRLSISCLEYLIARKVRSVFDIYREVFHSVRKVAKDPETFKQLNNILNGGSELKKKASIGSSVKRVNASIAWVKGVSELLNLSASARAAMLNSVARDNDLPLIEYVPSEAGSRGVLRSATELLRKYRPELKTRVFNDMMAVHGFLTRNVRQRKNGPHQFWTLTEAGLEFGQNCVNPQNPKETQPQYYSNRFEELLGMVSTVNVLPEPTDAQMVIDTTLFPF